MRQNRLLAALIALLALLPAFPAEALTLSDTSGEPLVLDLDSITGYEWHRQHRLDTGSGVRLKPDDYHKISERLEARLRLGEFALGMRLEGLWYPDSLDLVRELGNGDVIRREVSEDRLWLEQFYLRYTSRSLTVDMGDYYVTFGRGLAVSMRRDGEDIDQSLRGGKLALRIRESRVEGFAGFSNTLNVDPFHETYQADPLDLLSGLRLEQRILESFTLGGHVVSAKFGALEPATRQRFIAEDESLIVGGSFEMPDIADHAALYVEGNYMHRAGREMDGNLTDFHAVTDNGAGVYASLSVFVENLTVNGEYKYYNDFIFRRGHTPLSYLLDPGETPPADLNFYEDIYYHNVPTLERTDIETNRTYGNDHGFRLRTDYTFTRTQTMPYAVLYFTNNKSLGSSATNLGGFGNAGDSKGDRIWHAYGGVTQVLGPWELFVDGGFRDELNRDKSQRILQLAHAKVGASVRVAPRHTLHGELFYLYRDYRLMDQKENDLDATLGYSFSPYLSLSFLYTLQQKDYAPGQGEDELNHFLAAELRSSPTGWLELSIFGGQTRESYRCFGGFCRQVPPFEGLKARVRMRF